MFEREDANWHHIWGQIKKSVNINLEYVVASILYSIVEKIRPLKPNFANLENVRNPTHHHHHHYVLLATALLRCFPLVWLCPSPSVGAM